MMSRSFFAEKPRHHINFLYMNKDTTTLEIINGLGEDLRNVFGENPFPIEVFPNEIIEFLEKLKDTMNFSLDYSAASLLYAVSVAIGNRIRLFVKNGWIEKSTLYIILVGRTGDVKSHAFSFFLKPIFKRDQQNYDDYKHKLKIWEQSDSEENNSESRPILKQSLMNDFTPEALMRMLSLNPRGIGIYSDEIAGFFNSFNRYHKGSDQELFLSLWAGKPVVKNRVSGEDLRVDEPKIDIMGTIQESILKFIFQEEKMSNGFIDRILFSFPDKYYRNRWNDREIPLSMLEWYDDLIFEIFKRADAEETTIQMQPEAKEYLYNWQNNQSTIFDFDFERGISVKLQQYVLRFSILLETLQCIIEKKPFHSVSLESIIGAIKLRDYFMETSKKVFEEISANYFDSLTQIQKKAFESLPQNFKTAEALEQVVESGIMKKRSFMTFLKNKNLFIKIMHGQYEKRIQ